MNDSIQARLAARFEEVQRLEQLHDVPPHEVWAVVVDGQRAVCKYDTGPTGRAGVEGRVTAFVAATTTVPVPDVLALGDDFFVAAWHPDAPEPDAAGDATPDWARAAGRGLATLHDETAPRLEQFGRITLESTPDELAVAGHPDWHAAAVAYVERLESTLAEYGHTDVVRRAREHLREHPDAFEGAGEPVLCHGWWSPEHVSVRDGAVACALDFEHAIVAPGEWDYWRTVLPTFNGGHAQDAFREGYEAVRDLPPGFEDRRSTYMLLHSLYFFESLYVQAQHDPEETAKRAAWIRERVDDLLAELGDGA